MTPSHTLAQQPETSFGDILSSLSGTLLSNPDQLRQTPTEDGASDADTGSGSIPTTFQTIGDNDAFNDLYDRVQFGMVTSLRPDEFCMDVDRWCEDATIEALLKIDDPDGMESEEAAMTFVNMNVMCGLARSIMEESEAVLIATGTADLTRSFLDGTIDSVSMHSSVSHAIFASSDSISYAETSSVIPNSTVYSLSDAQVVCGEDAPLSGEPPLNSFFCTDSIGGSNALAVLEAAGTISSQSSARAGTISGNDASLNVRGRSIQRFTTAVDIGSQVLAVSNTTATVESMTQVFLMAFAASYTEACWRFTELECEAQCELFAGLSSSPDIVPRCQQLYCSATICDSAFAEQSLNATYVGESFAESFGNSIQMASVSFSTRMTFEYAEDRKLSEMMNFGYEGELYKGANVSVACLN